MDDDSDECRFVPPNEKPNADESDQDSEEYQVEQIVGFRLNRFNEPEYHVKWEGYCSESNTWEPLSNLSNCGSILEQFELEHSEAKDARLKMKRIVTIDDTESSGTDGSSYSQNNGRNSRKRQKGRTKKRRRLRSVSSSSAGSLEPENNKALLRRKREAELTKGERFELEMENIKEVSVLPLPNPLPDRYESLAPREWISNFIIDDMIQSLINQYELNGIVVYVPSNYFKYAQTGNSYKEIATYLHKQKANGAELILCLCCTGQGISAEHWILGVISKKNETIFVLDSWDSNSNRREIFKCLNIYITLMTFTEGLSVDLEDWENVYSDDCPLQRNSYDCGLFAVLFAHAIFQKCKPQYPPKHLSSLHGRRWIYTHLKKYVGDQTVDTKAMPRQPPRDKDIGTALKEAIMVYKEYDPIIHSKKCRKEIRNLLNVG